jgi:hypothetical protein
MNDERKALWKETYNKKVETMPVRQAASEADDVVSEWDKRNLFGDQYDPLAICSKVDSHCHVKMVSTDPDAALAWPEMDVEFAGNNRGTISGGAFDAETKTVTFDVIVYFGRPSVGVVGHVKFRHLGEPKSFSMTVVA